MLPQTKVNYTIERCEKLIKFFESAKQTIRFNSNTQKDLMEALEIVGIQDYIISTDEIGFVCYVNTEPAVFNRLYNLYENFILGVM